MDWHESWYIHGRVPCQKHPNQALPLVLGLDSLLAKDRLHHSARLEATWACRSARICQKH